MDEQVEAMRKDPVVFAGAMGIKTFPWQALLLARRLLGYAKPRRRYYDMKAPMATGRRATTIIIDEMVTLDQIAVMEGFYESDGALGRVEGVSDECQGDGAVNLDEVVELGSQC